MKKWLTAILASKEKVLSIWNCTISDNTTDVIVPDNTIFYFFCAQKADLEMIQLNFLDTAKIVWMDERIHALALDHKLYCCGKKVHNSLVVNTPSKKIILENFFNTQKNFNFEFVD